MEKKRIRTSKRGLTFSIENNEKFVPGSHYTYIVGNNKIVIKSNPEGNLKVSRKKCGSKIKSLFDLRSKTIVDKIQNADYIEIEVKENTIIVRLCKKSSSIALQNKVFSVEGILQNHIIAEYEIPKVLLASGMGYQQITIDDYISDISNNVLEKSTGSEFETIKSDLKNVFSVVSLFSGAGMLDYPFALDDSFQIVFACDMDKGAVKTYEKNIGLKPYCGSISNVKELNKTDIVIGGPSCKAFSNANRSKTRLLEHPDFFLVKEYIRVVKETIPSVFVIENVPEFVTAQEGELLNEVIEELSEYEITVNKVCDGDVGGYTKRKRIFIIGSKVGAITLSHVKMLPQKTVAEALNKVDSSWFNYKDISASKKQTVDKMSYVKDGSNWEDVPRELRGKSVHSSYLRRLHPDELAPTLTNFRKTCLLPPISSPNPNRILSVAEASALSGFPKEFHFLGTLGQRQQQVGNGVPFALGNFVKNAVKKALQKATPLYC